MRLRAANVRQYDLQMTSWREFCDQEPAMALTVERLFGVGRHKTIATVRADGSPRISGIECSFVDGALTFASMTDARKLADLRRDPRFALHGPSIEPVEDDAASWPGEAKIAGVAVLGEGSAEGQSFVADISEVVVTHLNEEATTLVVEWWTPTGGRQRIERA